MGSTVADRLGDSEVHDHFQYSILSLHTPLPLSRDLARGVKKSTVLRPSTFLSTAGQNKEMAKWLFALVAS